jgi:hypothetical protein
MNMKEWLRSEAQSAISKNDKERLRLMECYSRAFELRETDPDGAFAIFNEGRQLAQRLGEPWWELYYQKYCIDALVHFKRDFREVVDMAVQCVLELRKPANAAYPGRIGVWDSLVAAYLGVDAEGYSSQIQEALDTLDREIPEGPSSDRYLLLARRQVFGLELNRYQDVYRHCMAELKLASEDTNQHTAAHFATFVFCDLCIIGAHVKNWEQVGRWAKAGQELAEAVGHQCERAETVAWQAVVALHTGNRTEATRLYNFATSTAKGLGMPPNRGYFEAMVAYALASNDLEGALAAREDELRTIENRGRLLYETRLHIERCRYLSRLKRLRAEDLATARTVAGRLRLQHPYLEQLDELAVS